MGDGKRDQLSILPRDFSVLSSNYSIKRRPSLKFRWGKRFHIPEQFQIVLVMVMVRHPN
jgi:hypothetical protein